MKTKRAIELIDEYILEPNNINEEWVELIQVYRQALVEANVEEVRDLPNTIRDGRIMNT